MTNNHYLQFHLPRWRWGLYLQATYNITATGHNMTRRLYTSTTINTATYLCRHHLTTWLSSQASWLHLCQHLCRPADRRESYVTTDIFIYHVVKIPGVTITTTVLRPFVRDYTGEPVPEETLTHPPAWSSSNLYQLLPSTTIHSILLAQITCLAIFLHNLFLRPLWSTSLVWSPPPHIPYISSPNQCLLFAAHAHTIATCFAVVSILYHLFLVFLSTPGVKKTQVKTLIGWRLIGWRNVWNMRWRAPDQEVDQRGHGKRLCKKIAKHVNRVSE